MTKTKPIVAVVENDSAMLKALARLLMIFGYPAELYTSAEAFLARGNDQDLGCLILDINLGGASGIELQRTLINSGSTLPIIFITAQSDQSILEQAVKMGCIAYLKKPFESPLLLQALNKALHAD